MIRDFREIELPFLIFPVAWVAFVLFFFFGGRFPQINRWNDVPLTVVIEFKQHHGFKLVVWIFSLYYGEHFAYAIVDAVSLFIGADDERVFSKRERHLDIWFVMQWVIWKKVFQFVYCINTISINV